MIRVLHFSDVHIEADFSRAPVRAFLGKRLLGYSNLALRRRPMMADALPKIQALHAWALGQKWDAVLCTGDYTALGTPAELSAARTAVEPLARLSPRFVTMPGNHDWYLSDSVKQGWFEQAFGKYLCTDLEDVSVQGIWPQVHFIGDNLCIVAINSARPNAHPFRSSGRVSDEELQALETLSRDPRLASKFVIIATHYAPRLENGQPDRPHHGLENADALLDAASGFNRRVVVHGHVHHRYHLRELDRQLNLCCAGSLTHKGREGFWVYEIEGDRARGVPGYWTGKQYALADEGTVVL